MRNRTYHRPLYIDCSQGFTWVNRRKKSSPILKIIAMVKFQKGIVGFHPIQDVNIHRHYID